LQPELALRAQPQADAARAQFKGRRVVIQVDQAKRLPSRRLFEQGVAQEVALGVFRQCQLEFDFL
jgi:hypothetical protein